MMKTNRLKYSLLSILSGILLILSFPPFNLYYLAFISLIPLFYVIKDEENYNKFIYGFVTGLVFYSGLIYWIATITVAGTMVLVLSLSFLFGIWTFAYSLLSYRGNFIALNVLIPAIIFTLIQYIEGVGHLGFPWGNLAYSQYANIYFIQIIDITGIDFIAFIIVIINYILFSAITIPKKIDSFKYLLLAVTIILLIYSYGIPRKRFVTNRMTQGPKIGLCQGNIDQSIKWDIKYRNKIWNTYIDETMECIDQGADLILWPESAAPYNVLYNKNKSIRLLNISRKYNKFLLVGATSYKYNFTSNVGWHYDIYNSALFINPASNKIGVYNKIQLVPMGEYVPFKKYIPFIKKIVYSRGGGDFIRGNNFVQFKFNGWKIGTLICYESLFDGLSRRYRNDGVQILANITNDAWYKKTSSPYQHFSFGRFRAIENRVPFIRAANTGISGIFLPNGDNIRKTKIFTKTVVVDNIKIYNNKSYFSILGKWFDGLMIGFFIIILMVEIL